MQVFSSDDIKYASNLGISEKELELQWSRIQEGFPKVVLDRAALINDGIHRLSEEESKYYGRLFERAKNDFEIVKFTPASGAASRMFAPMRNLREDSTSIEAKELLRNLESFPFYKDILKKLESVEFSISDLKKDPSKLAHFCLDSEGMDFDRIPKGMVTFYRDDKHSFNAFEMHCLEADEVSEGFVHFTVSDEYLAVIEKALGNDKSSFSVQHPSTHYLASYVGKPLRNEEGNLQFWPSGHGALLRNLEAIDSDIVLIKNIDNIQAPANNSTSIEVKKTLIGMAINIKEELDTFLLQLKYDTEVDLENIQKWIQQTLDPAFNFSSIEEVFNYLNRPIRVAGMVLNEGKAGGGPFWVKNNFGTNLQIIEGAQIDTEDQKQKEILASSTHFNPVEIVCCLRDFEGNSFDLSKFVDLESGFLSRKNVMGKNATIMERPGLWNGSMANWISIFVEIPLESFTPVKSIFDLLPSEILDSQA